MNCKLNLEMQIGARFISNQELPPEEQESLDALNQHTEAICETLQPIFQQLIIEMLELKRQTFTQGG